MKIKKSLLFFILFNFIIGARLELVDLLLLTTVLVFGFSLFYLLFLKRTIDKTAIKFLTICMFSLSYNFLISGLWGFKDTTGVEFSFKLILYFIGAYFLIRLYKIIYTELFGVVLLRHIFWVGVVDSIFIIVVYISDTLRHFLINNILAYSYAEHTRAFSGLRSFSMSVGVGADASVVLAIYFMIGLVLILYNDNIKKNKVIGLILIFFATILTARTGLYIIIFFTPLYVIFSDVFFHKKKISVYKMFKMVFNFLALASIILVVLSFTLSNNSIERFIGTTYGWAFEGFENSSNAKFIGTKSMETVFNRMYFIPQNDFQVLFGNSNFGRRSEEFEYIRSDVGYVRLIHAIGIIGTILLFFPIIYMAYFSIKYKKYVLYSKILLFIVCVNFIVNFKELFFMSRGSGSIIMLIFNIMIYQKVLEKRNFFSMDKHIIESIEGIYE